MIFGKIFGAFRAQLNKLANFFWTADPIAQMQYEYDSAVDQLKEGRVGLEQYRGLVERVGRQVKEGEATVTKLTAQAKAYLKSGDRETAASFALQLTKAKTQLEENKQQLAMHDTAYQNNLKKIQYANKKLVEVKDKIAKYDADLKMSSAEAEVAKITQSFNMDVTTDFGQLEDVIQRKIDTNRGKARVASDLSSEGLDKIHAEEKMEKSMADDALKDLEVELGMRARETTPVAQATKDLGPGEEATTAKTADRNREGVSHGQRSWKAKAGILHRGARGGRGPRRPVVLSLQREEGGLAAVGRQDRYQRDQEEQRHRHGGGGRGGSAQAENPDPNSITTVKEYSFEAASRLPEVPGTADYTALGKPRVVQFAVNVWAGWAPIIWANHGSKPKKIWKDAKGGEFQVELILADNPVDMGNTFAAGKVHIGWATVDMLPLVIERLHRDPRTMPRVFQQIDWSNGGDGIVSRDAIKNIADLRGKTVVLAQNSPSHYFLLNMLLNGGVQPSEVHMDFTKDAFQAAAAFNQDKTIAACVSWSPDIYNLTKPGMGNKLLISTGTANKLIADVWYARADFARDNPEIIEGLVRGILDAAEDLKDPAKQIEVGKLMDEFYSLPGGTGHDMLGDAHWTNYAENRDFFLNQNNPTNFERTYNTAFILYKAIRAVDTKTPFDQIMDFSVIKKLGGDAKYANQQNEYEFKFTPVSSDAINVESAVLTKTVVISFFPNSFELYKKVPNPAGGPDLPYDANVDNTLEDIGKLAGTFGAARIQISGHTDASMRNSGADENLVKQLSLDRANSVKEALLRKFKKMDPNQFVVAGYGWDKPADPKDPDNHAKNRRVEIKVVPAEAQ